MHAHRLSLAVASFSIISVGSPIIVPLFTSTSVVSAFTMGIPLTTKLAQLLVSFGLPTPFWAGKLGRFEHLLGDLVHRILHPRFLVVLTPVLVVLRFHTYLDTKIVEQPLLLANLYLTQNKVFFKLPQICGKVLTHADPIGHAQFHRKSCKDISAHF